MNKLISLSKLLQIVLFLGFFLPFFKSCQLGGPSAEELEAHRIADSTRVVDSIAGIKTGESEIKTNENHTIDNGSNAQYVDSTDTSSISHDPGLKSIVHNGFDSIEIQNKRSCFFNRINNDSTVISRLDYDHRQSITKGLINNHHFLKAVLQPNGGFSGIGYIIDHWYAFVYLFGIFVSLLLCLLVLVFKVLNYIRYLYSNLILSIIGFVFLFNTYGPSYYYGKYLWGYWICLLIWIFLMIFDLIIICKKIQMKPNNGS